MFHVWTEKFDTKIQPNVGRYGRYTSPMDLMGRCLEGCVCVCGTVLVGEVDVVFFCFRNGHLTSIENPPTCCFAQRSIKHTGGFARNFVYTWFVAGS